MVKRSIPITEEIYQVGGQGLTAAEDAAIYAIVLPGRAALVDSGCGRGTERLLSNLESVGVLPEQVHYLLLTHCHYDHTGGAADLRARLACPVVAHELDARFIEAGDDQVTAAAWYGATLTPCVVDLKLAGAKQELDLGSTPITALHIPGHSPGSVAYVMFSQNLKVVFAQDVHGPLDPSLLSNREDYLVSLQHLLALDADILCEGHFGIFRGKKAITDFIRRFLR